MANNITSQDIVSFRSELANLESQVIDFNVKVNRCVLTGLIDRAHNIESNIEKLDSELARIRKFESTAIEEVRNIGLQDEFENFRNYYNNEKSIFEAQCKCVRI